MQLFAPSLAFVDLETTGTRAAADRITEVGIVRVDADAHGGPPRVQEWSSLVDPGVPIPPVIQSLTGITDAMVGGAPTFSRIAADIEERLADCVFVAHNARFDRVSAHFAGDWRSETDLRLSQEIRRIEFEETAGELGALLREATLVKSLLPALNRSLRRKEEAGVLALADDGAPRFLCAAAIDPAGLALTYGPYASRRSARETLRAVAAERGLCWRRLGLEKRASGPCFQRQLKRCAGACVGAEGPAEHDRRLADALARWAIPRWPFAGPGIVREHNAKRERTDVHVLHHWCWLDTARDEGDLAALLDAPPRPRFDIDVARLLLKRWTRGSLALVDVTRGSI